MRLLSVDYGEARTGLAVSDKDEIIASPLCVISEKNSAILIGKILEIAAENEVEGIVVGDPVNMDGSRGLKSAKCSDLARRLRERSSIPVEMWDERLTTVSAIGIMNENNRRGRKRRETIDSVAAAVILEAYMAYRKNKIGRS